MRAVTTDCDPATYAELGESATPALLRLADMVLSTAAPMAYLRAFLRVRMGEGSPE